MTIMVLLGGPPNNNILPSMMIFQNENSLHPFSTNCLQYSWCIVHNLFQMLDESPSVFGVATGAACSIQIARRKENGELYG